TRSSAGHSPMAEKPRTDADEGDQEAGEDDEEEDEPSPTDSAPDSATDTGVSPMTEQTNLIPAVEPSSPHLEATPAPSVLTSPPSNLGAFRLPPLSLTPAEGNEPSEEDYILRSQAPAGQAEAVEWRDLEGGQGQGVDETERDKD
ncbi:hypothetical protein HK097_007474, partial [Rhizophlyctis rosea]